MNYCSCSVVHSVPTKLSKIDKMFGTSVLVVVCAIVGGCLAIYGNQHLPEEQGHERREREPFMNVMPPFLGMHPPPMMQGYGYAGRPPGNYAMARAYEDDSYASNLTYKYNDTGIYNSEFYEPNYCENLLLEELTKAIKYSVIYNLDGKYGKLKKYRYAVIVSSILPEAVYDALYKGDDIVSTITNAVVEQYTYIPLGTEDPKVIEFEADAFKEKAKYATTEILDGMCKHTYCCLQANRNVDYNKIAEKPAYQI